mgnify:CR=1 FL=1
MGMNNLLGAGTEFVCSDGRMSVNGICKTPEQAIQSVQPITASPVQDSDGSDNNTNNYKYDKTVKSTFEWDFDKPNNKVENFGTTIKDNVTAYDKYIADKLGISSKAITINRAAASTGTILSGGSLIQAASPWGLAFGIGQMIKGKDKPEVTDTMSFQKTPPVTYTDNSNSGPGETTEGTFGSSVNEATGSRGSGTGFSDYS